MVGRPLEVTPPRRVVLVAGCSGSGKSTYVARVFGAATVVSADHFFQDAAEQAGRSYPEVWDARGLHQAHAGCMELFRAALQRGDALVVVDNTNIEARDRAPYIKAAISAGYPVEIHVLGLERPDGSPPSIDQLQSYAKLCFGRNRHGVPLMTILRQLQRLQLRPGIHNAAPGGGWLGPLSGLTGEDEPHNVRPQ